SGPPGPTETLGINSVSPATRAKLTSSTSSARLAFPVGSKPSSFSSQDGARANDINFLLRHRVTFSLLFGNLAVHSTVFLAPSGISRPSTPLKFTLFGDICLMPMRHKPGGCL